MAKLLTVNFSTESPPRFEITRHWLPIGLPKASATIPARPGSALGKVSQIVVGDTGRPGLGAMAASGDKEQAFGHFLIDDQTIVECVPALTSCTGRQERANYLVSTGTQVDTGQGMLFVNLCYGGGINQEAAYSRWSGFVAALCKMFGTPADEVAGIIAQPLAFRTANTFGEGRDDPAPALDWAGRSIGDFHKDVAALTQPAHPGPPPAPIPPHDQPGPRRN